MFIKINSKEFHVLVTTYWLLIRLTLIYASVVSSPCYQFHTDRSKKIQQSFSWSFGFLWCIFDHNFVSHLSLSVPSLKFFHGKTLYVQIRLVIWRVKSNWKCEITDGDFLFVLFDSSIVLLHSFSKRTFIHKLNKF